MLQEGGEDRVLAWILTSRSDLAESLNIWARLTLVGATGDKDFCFSVEDSTKLWLVVLLDGLTETKSALWV